MEPEIQLFGDSSIEPVAGIRTEDAVYMRVDRVLQAVEGPGDLRIIWFLVCSLLAIVLFIPDVSRLVERRL